MFFKLFLALNQAKNEVQNLSKLKIMKYFKTAESKSFGEAKAKLGDDVSYGDLRMGLSYLESLEKT